MSCAIINYQFKTSELKTVEKLVSETNSSSLKALLEIRIDCKCAFL